MEQSLFPLVPDYFPEWLNQNNLESGTGGDYRLEQEGQLRFERYRRTFNQILTRSGFDGCSMCRKWQLDNSIIIGIWFASSWRVPAVDGQQYDTLTRFSNYPAYRPTISGRNVHTPYFRVPLSREYSIHTPYFVHTSYRGHSQHPDDSWIIPINWILDGWWTVRSGIFTWPGWGG